MKETSEIVNEITNYINTFNDKSVMFNEAMSKEHRTLQQSFTRLCLKWIEYVASDEYRTDGRNEGSHDICVELLEGFKQLNMKKGYSDVTLEFMSKPSGYLSCI